MTHVGHPPSLTATFNSVFSSPSISHGRGRRSATAALSDHELDAAAIKDKIRHQLKPCLGIESDHFVYGVGDGGGKLGSFQLPLRDCQQECLCQQPSRKDLATQQARWADSPVWKLMVTSWQREAGVEKLKQLIAEVMHGLLPEYVQWAYRKCYRADVITHLTFWVRHVYAGLISFILSALGGTFLSGAPATAPLVSPSDIVKWEEIALTRLGQLRVEELYDMLDGDGELEAGAVRYGIEDLRHFITSPATRSYLTSHFIQTLTKRLLHPASSTVKILRFYISVIRAFRQLEPKGVLLDRVARPIRRYLRERDDAVKVVVNGLFSDPAEVGSNHSSSSSNLFELASELMNRSEAEALAAADDELDWDNMEWVPDPVDAAPDYIKSQQHTDVVSSLTSLFDSKEVFIKELQTALADRLLRNKSNFDLEISIVHHLESVLGEAAVQGCEVMLRDVLESSKVNQAIQVDRRSASAGTTTATPSAAVAVAAAAAVATPELDAKILSRLFWPAMPEQAFNLPEIIRKQQEEYEAGFEAVKNSRKLTWVPAVGHVEIELEFADGRVFADQVLPYQATVIHAFGSSSSTAPLTVSQLASQLSMSAALVRSACIFWVSKLVLTETSASSDTFTTLERLPVPGATTSISGDNTIMGNTHTPKRGDNTDDDDDDDVTMSNIPSTGGAGAGAGAGTATASAAATNMAAAAAAAEAAAAQAAKQAEDEERRQKMAIYHQFIISMLTNAGAMQLPRISMMLGMVVPGGFPFRNDELKDFLTAMAKEGVLEVGPGGNWKVASSSSSTNTTGGGGT